MRIVLHISLAVLKQRSDRQKLLRKIRQTKRQLEDEKTSSKARKALKAELFDLRVDLNYVVVRFSIVVQLAFFTCASCQNYPKLEKYVSLYPPKVRSGEGGAAPVHSGASSSVTDEKREKLREWVRERMHAGEMSSEPETLEHRQSVQKSVTQQWVGSIDESKRSVAVDEDVIARHDADVPDDFFEDGTEDDDSEVEAVEESSNARFSKVPAKRRLDMAENHPDKYSNPTEQDRGEQNIRNIKKSHRKLLYKTASLVMRAKGSLSCT